MGFNLALLPDTLIVQAWRSASWDAGQYSLANFRLVARGAGTRLQFDHKGFPDAAAEHLAQGWHINYWEPLAKILS
jgi:activator of HSP90 ATPase